MEKFFQKYPKIFYDGLKCVDISRRAKIADSVRNAPNLFYPLTIKAGLRPDTLADAYYEDAELDWMIYLTNEIVDPYYEWYLDETEFEDFLVQKYGTLEHAHEKVKYYRTNWASDMTEITPSHYDNTLVWDAKQYYSPNYGPGARILSYSRKKEDWLVNTNSILRYDIDYAVDSNTFANGEILDIKYSGEVVGGGEVITANATVLFIQHISGNVVANSTFIKTLVGETSTAEATSNAYEVVQENITLAEGRFWSSVSHFDWELARNEAKKHIKIMDKSYVQAAAYNLRLKLQEE